jgi:hypothetical protein
MTESRPALLCAHDTKCSSPSLAQTGDCSESSEAAGQPNDWWPEERRRLPVLSGVGSEQVAKQHTARIASQVRGVVDISHTAAAAVMDALLGLRIAKPATAPLWP